jgi:glycerophosphoryl diester phosphodiesterase
MTVLRFLAVALALPCLCTAQGARVAHAHAHNDYVHARPLHEALEHGFTSIEADVHLVRGQLLVAHHKDSTDATRTLEALYLAPLRAYVRDHREPLTLLIDVKSDSEATYAVLDTLLRRYADVFTIYAGGERIDGPVQAIISGERAIGTMSKARVRFAGIDGRIADLAPTRHASAALMPLVSDSWDKITKWKGVGPVPDSVRTALERVVSSAHARGQRVRFWGTADNPAVWQVLVDAKVDLIGADDLDALRAFLDRQRR